jgi:hypothetical protein
LLTAEVRVADAYVDLAALTNLAALLRHVLNDRFTSSNARLSGVSILSRDQNREELHATPNEASAPLCATTGRPVRGRTADDDRHAGMLWQPHRRGTDARQPMRGHIACRSTAAHRTRSRVARERKTRRLFV